MEQLQSYNDLNAADLGALSSKIRTALTDVTAATQNGTVTGGSEQAQTLLGLINRRQIVTGETKDFSALIASLKEKKAALGLAAKPTGTLRSPGSGYVIYSVDGYENILGTDNITELTADKMQSLEPEETSGSAVCKIVGDYEWYIAAVVPFSESLNMKEGSTVTVRTALRSVPELQCTVKYINKHYAEEITLADIAGYSFVSVSYLCTLFKKTFGTTIIKYITSKRISEAKKLLNSGKSISDTAAECGFNDYANFMRTFKKAVGVSPKKYTDKKAERE